MINELPDKLKNDVIEYCRLNKIDDIDSFIIKMIRQSLTIEMYGRVPKIFDDISEPIIEEKKSETIVEEIKIEPQKEEIIVSEEKSKNEYQINLDLNKKNEIVEPQTPKVITQINKDEDIYGEGKGGWFGGSNLYDLINKKR